VDLDNADAWNASMPVFDNSGQRKEDSGVRVRPSPGARRSMVHLMRVLRSYCDKILPHSTSAVHQVGTGSCQQD